MMQRLCLSLGLALLTLACLVAPAEDKVLYEKQSPFNNIVVTENDRGLRTLLFEKGGARQSVVKLGDPDHIELPYARVATVGLAICERPQRVLVIGLGGGTIPMFLRKHYPRMTIDAVDIDPGVVQVAKDYFGFREDARLRAHVADGRKFIEDCRQPYDMIILDAFGPDSIPYSLATIEFLHAVRKAVSPQGLVIADVWSSYSNPLYEAMIRTYQEAFERLYIIEVRGAGNRIFIALPRADDFSREDLAQRATTLSQRQGFRFDLGEAVQYGFQAARVKDPNQPVLRDGERPTPR